MKLEITDKDAASSNAEQPLLPVCVKVENPLQGKFYTKIRY